MKRKDRKLESALRSKAHQIRLGLIGREAIAVKTTAEAMEQVSLATERDMAVQQVERESRLLREVESTLVRLGDRVYGLCIDCDDEIHAKRLAAIPWASRCIHCQNVAERMEASSPRVEALAA